MPYNFPKKNYVSLKDRIAEACKWSKSQPGAETHLSLKGGLHIWIGYLAMTKAYTLRIGRQHVQPSNVEWKTVLANWIWNAHAQASASTQLPHWNYLSANIPDREIKQLSIFAKCQECDSEIMADGYCLMGHWQGAPTSNDTDGQTPPRIS